MICCLIVILFLYSFLNQLMMEILGFIIVFMAISYLRPFVWTRWSFRKTDM